MQPQVKIPVDIELVREQLTKEEALQALDRLAKLATLELEQKIAPGKKIKRPVLIQQRQSHSAEYVQLMKDIQTVYATLNNQKAQRALGHIAEWATHMLASVIRLKAAG